MPAMAIPASETPAALRVMSWRRVIFEFELAAGVPFSGILLRLIIVPAPLLDACVDQGWKQDLCNMGTATGIFRLGGHLMVFKVTAIVMQHVYWIDGNSLQLDCANA